MKPTTTKRSIPLVLVAAAATLAAPVARADDHGDTLESATEIIAGDTAGTLDSVDDEDWFHLSVTVPGRHWFFSTGGTDTAGFLYDAAGALIIGGANYDNDGSGQNFYFTRVLQAGEYFIRVQLGRNGVLTGNYTLGVRHPQRAVPFSGPDRAGSLDVLGELDLFRIDIATPGRIWVYTTGGTDTSGTLYDIGGNPIAGGANSDDDGSGRNFRFTLKLLPGTYYLLVHNGGAGSLTGSYSLSLRHIRHATPFAGADHDGSLGVLGELDFYRLKLSNPGRFWLYSTGPTDTFAVLYDAAGNAVAGGANDSNDGADDNFLTTSKLTPATYYLLVEAGPSGNQTGRYTLHLRDAERARPLFGAGSSDHRIDTFGDIDLFAFTTTGGEARFVSSGQTDTFGSIYDSAGNFVAGGANGQNDGEGNNFEAAANLPPGDYLLLVRGASLDLTVGNYQLVANFQPGDLTILSEVGIVVGSQDSARVEVLSSERWEVSGLPSWITASTTSGDGDGSITLDFAPNLSGATREANVSIGGRSFMVTQRPEGDATGESVPAQLAIAHAVVISIPTAPGVSYQIETSSDMAIWLSTGVTLQGDGAVHSVAFERSEARAFFRAVPR